MANTTAIPSIEPYLRSLLRIVAGFTFSCHGLQKLFGLFGGMGASGARAQFMSLPWVGGFLETFGGIAILLGIQAGPVAFLLSGEMAVAYFMMHQPRGWLPIRNGGELAILYCFLYLYIFAAGPGPLSLDYLVFKKYR